MKTDSSRLGSESLKRVKNYLQRSAGERTGHESTTLRVSSEVFRHVNSDGP